MSAMAPRITLPRATRAAAMVPQVAIHCIMRPPWIWPGAPACSGNTQFTISVAVSEIESMVGTECRVSLAFIYHAGHSKSSRRSRLGPLTSAGPGPRVGATRRTSEPHRRREGPHGIRVLEEDEVVHGADAGLHEKAQPAERAGLPRPAQLGPDALAGAADHGGAQFQGARTRPLEPLPPRERAGRWPHQPRVRAALRGHGTFADRAGGVQLLRPRPRHHGGAGARGQRGAQEAVDAAAARGQHPLRLRDDRAEGG